jgi:flavorubredoxin
MTEPFAASKITDRVYWVGAIDWALRDFHGYSTERGTTYNAYLVLAGKITLVDTVRAPFREEMISRIASVIDPSRIDYIISNHSEMDHSGCQARKSLRNGERSQGAQSPFPPRPRHHGRA